MRKVVSGGKRNEAVLTEKQKDDAVNYALKYNISRDAILISENMSTSFGLLYGQETLYIGTDVLPTESPKRHKSVNSNLSMKAALAHELAGHRAAALANKTHSDPVFEEIQASIRASLHGIELSEEDRQMLIEDAKLRLKCTNCTFDEIRSKLWLD